ncbi:heavy metal-associated isoprenylated plant protein 7-like isoform X2 [Prosopis cineraria]|uniref:heavy metal-associated isoprenylated plant protein 7-like isoform X2 n=1 Tax=Prosopis cineraria TaxID=364024 RepID=UPI0024102EE6|nr:heavy metal-associated isoprenylated plant protein 7-like isoform X2 [Prosopis cineraria]
MPEEKMEEEKKEGSKEEKKTEEVKDEKKEGEEEASPEIVLKVDMHCEACARKVARALKGFEGVEEVTADSKRSKVVVKGKAADPMKVCERLQKKSGRKVELISPLPKPPEQKKKQEEEKESKDKEAQPQEKKEEAPPVVTVVLKVGMHCDACAQDIQKRIRKIQGVESVETDLGNDRVVVKGAVEPSKLVEYVCKRTGKQASIVKDEEKKEEDKKEDDNKKEDKKKEDEHEKDDDNDETDIIKRMEYWPSKYFTDYAYDPQIFSDENPNACSVM